LRRRVEIYEFQARNQPQIFGEGNFWRQRTNLGTSTAACPGSDDSSQTVIVSDESQRVLVYCCC